MTDPSTSGPGPTGNPWLAAQQSLIHESAAHVCRVSRLPLLWQQAQRVRKGATPSEVIYEEDRLKLLHYRANAPPKYDTPLVFVFLRNVLDFVRERTAADRLSLLGYCMGGTMSVMFTALHPDLIRNLILMAAGIDFSTREGLINLWTDHRNFDADAFVEAYGNIPVPGEVYRQFVKYLWDPATARR